MGDGVLNLLKILLTVLLIPFVYVFATSFHMHLVHYASNVQEFFLWGVLAYLIVFLFIYQFWGIFEAGQKVMTQIFNFAVPLDKFLSNAIPFYPVICLLLLFLIKAFFHSNNYTHYLSFFTGFTFAMHILLVSQDLQNQEKGVFRPNYFFSFSLVFVINILLVILLLDLAFGKFTFMKFFKLNFGEAKEIYLTAFKHLTFK